MSTISVTNVKHESSASNNLVLTSGGDTQVIGALGLGGATYGTSGQFLQSQGSGSAPQWATPSGGITWLTAATLTSQTSVTITGIDTTAQFIIIAIANGQSSGSAAEGFRLRLGNGSLQTGSVYRYNIADNASTSTATDDKYLINQGTVGPSQIYDGHILLTRVASSDWAISQTCGNRGGSNGGTYGGGEYFGTDFIDRIQIANGATTYGAGTVRVGYIL